MIHTLVPITIRIPPDMVKRIKKQSKKEGRSDAAFIRRVLDRYLLEQEFRGGAKDSVAVAAQETINQNRELLEKLRNT